MELEDITKEDYIAYERVRMSGVTNMFYITNVCEISGLSKDKVLTIMKNIKALMEKYPDVRNNV